MTIESCGQFIMVVLMMAQRHFVLYTTVAHFSFLSFWTIDIK